MAALQQQFELERENVGNDPRFEAIRRVEQDLRLEAVPVYAVVLAAVVRAREESVPPVVGAGDSQRQRIAERHVAGSGEIARVVVAEPHVDEPGKAFELGLRARERNGARDGVLAEERALRAMEHLHGVDVQQVTENHAVAGSIDAIHEHADRAFEASAVADRSDAADLEAVALKALGGLERHARAEIGQLLDRERSALFDCLPVQLRDGDGHVLPALLALLRSDDDLLETRKGFRPRGARDGRGLGRGLVADHERDADPEADPDPEPTTTSKAESVRGPHFRRIEHRSPVSCAGSASTQRHPNLRQRARRDSSDLSAARVSVLRGQ